MTHPAFTKSNLTRQGLWITYTDTTGKSHFVARFRGGQSASVGTFMTHLRRHHTPAAYLARLEAGDAPLTVAKSTGYMLSHVKRWLRQGGYPVTPAGFDACMADQAATWRARR